MAQFQRPGVASLADAFPAPPRGSAAPAPSAFSSRAMGTDYLASLLQRHAPSPLPAASEGLSAYQTRDLLQSRAGLLGRLKPSDVAGGEALLGVAQHTAAWQLRQRDAGAGAARGGSSAAASSSGSAAPALPSSSVRGGDYAGLVAQVIRGEVDRSRASSTAWAAHRVTEVQASEERIVGRRRPQTVYFERPSTLAPALFPQLLPFPARQARGAAAPAAAAGAAGEAAGDGSAAEADALASASAAAAAASAAALYFPDCPASADGVVAAPWRPLQKKRLTVPVVLRRPETASGSLPSKSPLRPPRRDTMLKHWESASSISASASASSTGAGGERPYTSQAARVLQSAPRLLEHFTAQGASDATSTVAAARRFHVEVAEDAGAGGGAGGGGDASGSSALHHFAGVLERPALPGADVLARALRPMTAVAEAGRGGAPQRPPSAQPPPEPPVEGQPLKVYHSAQYVGGLFGQHPLDFEAQMADLRDRKLKDLAKEAKAAKAGAGAAPKKK